MWKVHWIIGGSSCGIGLVALIIGQVFVNSSITLIWGIYYQLNREINQGDALMRSVVSNFQSPCALFENNTMACWGISSYSRFGTTYADTRNFLTSPAMIDIGFDGVGIAKLTTNEYASFVVLDADSVVYSTGVNFNKTITPEYTDEVLLNPGQTSGNENVNLWYVKRYTMYVKKRGSGEVYCKSLSTYALFGSSSTANHYTGFTLAPYLQDARMVVGNEEYTLVMYVNGTVAAFGRNYYKHLQDSDDTIVKAPQVL